MRPFFLLRLCFRSNGSQLLQYKVIEDEDETEGYGEAECKRVERERGAVSRCVDEQILLS